MTDWPIVTVVIVTYSRPEEIRRTLLALAANLRYPGPLRWHVADDGTGGNYLPDLARDFPELALTATVTRRQGWGANVNRALDVQGDKYLFLCEDDYVAERVLDLRRGVALLAEEEPGLGLIRYDGIRGHAVTLSLEEVDTREGRQDYLRLLPTSHTLYTYSNRPHLVHPRFHAAYGRYPEGLKLGATEEAFAHGVRDRQLRDPAAPGIAVLPEGIPQAFAHIGKSWQLSAHDGGEEL